MITKRDFCLCCSCFVRSIVCTPRKRQFYVNVYDNHDKHNKCIVYSVYYYYHNKVDKDARCHVARSLALVTESFCIFSFIFYIFFRIILYLFWGWFCPPRWHFTLFMIGNDNIDFNYILIGFDIYATVTNPF